MHIQCIHYRKEKNERTKQVNKTKSTKESQNATDAKQVGRWSRSRCRLFGSGNLGGRNTDAVDVAEEQDTLGLALRAVGGLNPLAGTGRGPHGLDEASPAGVGLGTVVLTHDGLDGLAGLVGVIEGDAADIVVQDVGLNDTVEDVATDEAEVTVDGGSSAAGKVPHLGLVVGEGGVSVLQEGDGHCKRC